MKLFSSDNQFALAAITFCLVGLALLVSVMLWRHEINQHPLFRKGTAAAADLQVAAVQPASTPSLAVPEQVLKEITEDPRNLRGQTVPPTAALSPALQFLYTLESPNIFPSQQ